MKRAVPDIQGFLQGARRVFMVAKKPSFDEFVAMARVTAIGAALLGAVGFLVMLVFTYFGIGF